MASFWNLFGKTSISEPEAKGGSTVPSRQSQPRPRPPTPSAEANTPHDAPVPLKTHRSDRAADKLANALTAKYLCELNPKHSHKSNVYGLLARELHDLTRQALAFRTARLPPRVLCRLNAFIANLCSAVPESSALPKTLGRIRGRFRGQRRVPPAEEAEEEEEEEDLPQISEEDLKQRLDCYISALWAHADAASEREAAKEAYKGNPKAAAAAEKQAAAQLEFANLRADLARVHATLSSFVNVCVAQAALVPNMTILQNIRPRHLLTPLAESLCLEVLGVPDVDANTRERVASLVEEYERQHSFFQAADTNAKKVLTPLLQELVEWLRKNEDNLVANSATEGMLAVIPEDLRHQLKNQVYYSADHFFEVFNSVRPRLAKLPIPLHPLLEDTTMDAAQAMKDMYRERLLLNEAEVAPADVTRLLSDLVHSLLEIRLEDARRLERAAGETSPADPPLEASQSTSGSRHTRPHANLTEHLVMRTINAASRTTSGGDSFFIVQVSSDT
mmetsp:Transcript_9641/g.22009  ORF Transcript_9641/g.22009 Transcript_9641/m.22009 type:complete len:504 (-) Transcript_9641:665-2176(-)